MLSIDENGSVQFGAEIRSGAKMELIETGIHYGTDQIFSEFNQIRPIPFHHNGPVFLHPPQTTRKQSNILPSLCTE